MSDQEAKDVALGVVQALKGNDLKALRNLLLPSAKWTIVGVAELDIDTFCAQFQHMLGIAVERDLQIVSAIAEGDMVSVETVGRNTYSDGRVYSNTYCQVYRVQDGKVVEVREYMDTAGAKAFFGMA